MSCSAKVPNEYITEIRFLTKTTGYLDIGEKPRYNNKVPKF